MSAETLAAALEALGLRCTVEARQGLALLTDLAEPDALADPRVRRGAIALLPAHGFTDLALELTEEPDRGAALSRD